MGIGQSVFQTRLQVNLGKVVPGVAVNNIISAGATNIDNLVTAAELTVVIQQYSKSITQIFVSILR